MKMRHTCFARIVSIMSIAVLSQTPAADDNLFFFESISDGLYLTPSGADWSLHGLINPAALVYARYPDAVASFRFNPNHDPLVDRVSFFAGGNQTSIGARYIRADTGWGLDMRLAGGFGARALGFGLGIGYTRGDLPLFDRTILLSGGALARPTRFFSTGLSAHGAVDGAFWESVLSAAVRPLGSSQMSISGDYALGAEEDGVLQSSWSAALAGEILEGIRLSLRYFGDQRLAAGVHIGLGSAAIATQRTAPLDADGGYQTVALRAGGYRRSAIVEAFASQSQFMELDLHPPVQYRRFQLFDKGPTLKGVLHAIQRAKHDPLIGGIAIRASEMQTSRERLWEIRRLLEACKSAGKKVYIYVDRLWFDHYHFASVADVIVMDPHGLLLLPGYVAGSTFYKNALEKLGVGFDSWRLFDFKSAFERYARTDMSDSAEAQRLALIEDLYQLARADICDARGLTSDQFDSLVNHGAGFLPEAAQKAGLVDTIGRWELVEALVDSANGGPRRLVSTETVSQRAISLHQDWGKQPTIALVYALGATSMGSGLEARKLAREIDHITKDKSVDAVVIRVDSPGGDAMAAALVGDAVKRCAKKKPCIVSMGSVAASGGYWISMFGDTIIAGPQTVTGSIGVIGAWVYDNGLGEKLGFTTDHVQIGEHADLLFGWRLPFLGVGLPNRNLSDREQKRAQDALMTMYRKFTARVAEMRNLSSDSVEAIARGRVWSGRAAENLGLIDSVGTLFTALELAAAAAGAENLHTVAIREYPEQKLFSADLIRRNIVDFSQRTDWRTEYFRMHLKHNGLPLMLLPLEDTPEDLDFQ